jgi:hypothetical protein
MKEKNKLTIVGMIENAYRMFGFLPDYLLASAKIGEKEHLKRAFENGAKLNGKTFDEFYYEFYESKEAKENTERLVEMFTYADRYGYAKALKKFTDENKSREDQA